MALLFDVSLDQLCQVNCCSLRAEPCEITTLTRAGPGKAIAAMAEHGNDLIVDEVMIGPDKAQEYRALLSRFDVRFVGLFAPLDVLETRERARGDRETGLARWQYHRVHRDMVYDLEIDTTTTTSLENARLIRGAFGL